MKLGEMPGYLLVAYQGLGDRVALEHNGATLIAHCDATLTFQLSQIFAFSSSNVDQHLPHRQVEFSIPLD